jgi:hypothetical protein
MKKFKFTVKYIILFAFIIFILDLIDFIAYTDLHWGHVVWIACTAIIAMYLADQFSQL